MEFNLFLPQMRLSFDDLVARARAAEAGGFVGITGMDHLVPPMADDQPMFEAIVTTTWLAAHTERSAGRIARALRRVPPPGRAGASSGVDRPRVRRPLRARHRMGLGTRGVHDVRCRLDRAARACRSAPRDARGRARPVGRRGRRLRRALSPAAQRTAGAASARRSHTDRDRRHRSEDARPRTRVRRLVERACRPTRQDRRAAVTSRRRARSIQQTVALIGRDRDRDAVTALATRRFGWSRPVIGTATELVDYYGTLEQRGVERVYTWFCDFAPPETIAEFGEDVIAPLRG